MFHQLIFSFSLFLLSIISRSLNQSYIKKFLKIQLKAGFGTFLIKEFINLWLQCPSVSSSIPRSCRVHFAQEPAVIVNKSGFLLPIIAVETSFGFKTMISKSGYSSFRHFENIWIKAFVAQYKVKYNVGTVPHRLATLIIPLFRFRFVMIGNNNLVSITTGIQFICIMSIYRYSSPFSKWVK